MYRLKEGNLPEDPTAPADLKQLGYFVNKEGQFRMIEYPDKNFEYRYSNQDRLNEIRREAFQICQREEVLKRASALGLEKLYLPQLTYTKPVNEASVPILAPPAEVLKQRKRIIVLVQDALQDLGILAYRDLQRAAGVNGGSIINFVKQIVERSSDTIDSSALFQDGAGITDKDKETPAFIVMNCGQLLYSYKLDKAMTSRSWVSMPRKSACHEPAVITAMNHIPGNYDEKEHIAFVIENVIKNKDLVAEDAEVYVVAIQYGAAHLLELLDQDFERYGSRITALALAASRVSSFQLQNPQLKAFLHQRAREWVVEDNSDNPRDCIAMPAHYAKEVAAFSQSSSGKKAASSAGNKPTATQAINWLETTTAPNLISAVVSKVLDKLHHLNLANSTHSTDINTTYDDTICPTFADGTNPYNADECVFTSPGVQPAILDFFEEVAQNPGSFHNPVFPTFTPSEPSNNYIAPLEESPLEDANTLHEKKDELAVMKAALHDTPDTPELTAGRQKLEKRIKKLEDELDALAKKALSTGSLGAGEAMDVRAEMKKEAENRDAGKWKRVGDGPKVMFAGSMVDRELVEAVGM
ncbi:hypothetical protein M011DRAFT_414524, partial [Sporormia fimetaria CBS 119925]